MTHDVLVLGAGIVGVSVALHLRRRGLAVLMVDRAGPGEGTSFGNAGLIQREAVFPRPFPRRVAELLNAASNRSVAVAYHTNALAGLATPLLRYWWHSAPARYAAAVQGHSRLIATCLDEHRALAEDAGATDLLRPIGYLQLFAQAPAFDAAAHDARFAQERHGVNYRILEPSSLAEAEPHLSPGKIGAIHWTDPYSVSDPHALTRAYAALLEQSGGTFAIGDASAIEQAGPGWRVQTRDGWAAAGHCVVALGAASTELTRRFGYAPPTFGKRGYHMHFELRGNAVLRRPVVDAESGFALSPMRTGVRLTTGAEFARSGAPATPVQLERAEPIARALLPLADRVDQTPWLGVRPCTPDMLPIIGRAPGHPDLWCAFGHAHQGLTLGPTTGRLLADMLTGATPFLDPTPYDPGRFH